MYVPLFRDYPEIDFREDPGETHAIPEKDALPGRVVFVAPDEGMAPRIKPGDLLLIDTERVKAQSRDCVVARNGTHSYLAIWLVQDRKVYLRWLNGRWPDMEIDPFKVRVLGTAVKILSGDL